MFYKLKKHRPYQYTPRFYKPEADSKERKPLRFQRTRGKVSTFSMVFFFIVISLLVYVLHLLTQIAKP